MPNLSAGTSVFAVTLALVLAGCTSVTGTASPPASVSVSAGASGTVLDGLPKLDTLPPATGYQRGCGAGQACSFGPAWTDNSSAPGSHNGCDTRNDLLHTQMTDVVFRAGSTCAVVSGTLADPYTGKTIHWQKQNASTVQADHVVPLALAYRLGASGWTQAERTTYANDETTVLLLVDGSQNERKGDSGPSEYLPPNHGYWCQYATKFVTILHTYKLPVLAADKVVLARILQGCP